MKEEQFIEQYNPIKNHIDSEAGWGGTLFETFGEELEYVKTMAISTKRVWTIIEGDQGNMFYVSGFRTVNRIGFVITTKDYKEEFEEVEIDCICS
jgi:hypothetical protein